MHTRIRRRIIALLLIAATPAASAACWQPLSTAGALSFSSEQPDGTVIRGEFQRFDGRLCLDPAAPDSARMRLTVATDSVNTGLPELDQALRGPEFFHSERWPQAVFESRSVERLDEHRYRVRGELTLRDVTRELVAEFDLDPGRDQARLTGSHTMSRLDYGVGQGQWSDTRWAADKVTLAFDIRLVQADEAATGQAAAND